MKREGAILLDRDGVINEMVYYHEHGLVDSPFVPSQFVLERGIGRTLRNLKEAGFELVLVSNQPGIAKGRFTMETFRRVQAKMRRLLAAEGVELDAEYYCFHHPNGRVAKYAVECGCRKPEPGMLLEAAREKGISLKDSFMVGDGVTDVLAGKNAGCKTVLVANLNGALGNLLAEKHAEPDFVARDVVEVSDIIKRAASRSAQR